MTGNGKIHVSLLAFPDVAVSTLTGIYEVLNAIDIVAARDSRVTSPSPFLVDMVAQRPGRVRLASGLLVEISRGIDEIASTDIVIAPAVILDEQGWSKGRYGDLVDWVGRMYEQGALLCSACSGVFLLAETGLFDGVPTTIHWGYRQAFKEAYPQIPADPKRVLVVAGQRQELITSGASMTWHDLVLYLIARHANSTTAQSVARFFALQWHTEGLSPYIVFDTQTDHGDAGVVEAQQWLETHFFVAAPVEEVIRRSKLSERSFKRRFTKATGLTPIAYIQRLRVEEAKRLLEATDQAVDHISWQVGYEDPAFFRRLFKRITGISPSLYRRRFQVPDFEIS